MFAFHAISARQSIQPCQVLSSTEEKSHSSEDLMSPSSIFKNRVEMISVENDKGNDDTILETAFAAVYRTIVSYVGILRDVPYQKVPLVENQ